MPLFTDCFDFNRQLSIYIHVPFCTKKCAYCAFFSKCSCTDDIKEKYTQRVVEEIKKLNSKKNGPYYTAFIGGGNPGCLSVGQLERIARTVCENGRPEEFTVEMNPENLCYNHFELFEKYFTRLSMGVQSLNERALNYLGRNSSLEETEKGIDLSLKLRDKTGCDLSYDLITCLPKWHDSSYDIKKLIDMCNPDHLSLYALTLEEGTPLFNKHDKLPNSDEQEMILSKHWKLLEESGYKQYEVSNFARNGKISLHNSVYWDYEQYAGIGPGASSTGFLNGKTFRIEANHEVVDWNYKVEELSNQEAFEEFVIMGLRHSKGLDISRMENVFNRKLKTVPKGFSIVKGFLVPDTYGLMTADYAASLLV